MVVYAYNPSAWEFKGDSKFEASLGYIYTGPSLSLKKTKTQMKMTIE